MAEEVVIRDYRKEDLPAVKWLMLQYLPRFYDDIDESFSESLTEAHEKGCDPYCYFTTAKRVWIAEIEGEAVGMMSVSIKRGGSVKISPIIIDEAYRGKGIGRKLIETLECKLIF
jgi:ribosomal protein S18 acetylase RimI-like enzyme